MHRQLIPYLADAVPGWFQATVTLYDAQGKELAYDDDWRFHPDPVLFYKIPADGQYVIEIKDAIYRGRADFVYRIAIGELPFVTGIFPLGQAGRQDEPRSTWRATICPENGDDGRPRQSAGHLLGERRRGRPGFQLGSVCRRCAAECLEKTERLAAKCPAGRASSDRQRPDRRPGDWDVFRLEGHAGQQVVAKVYARRLDSPLDSVLRLIDARARSWLSTTIIEDKGDGLNTHHADSLLNVTLPADGVYYLQLGDAQQQGGPEYAYRLRISQPQPDFALRVVPSS